MQAELTERAKELRSAFVTVAPLLPTALGTKQLIFSSSVYKLSKGIVLVYAVPCAWDLPHLASRASRTLRPVPVLAEQLGQYAEVLDKCLTSDNGSYGVVLMGRSSRQGAGPL